MKTTFATAAVAVLLTTTLSACGSDEAATASGAAGAGHYPVTVQNCGADVTFDKAPSDTLLVKPAAVSYLHELGILDDVVKARGGAYPRAYYDDATWAELQKIPMVSDVTDSTGHLQISKEVVVAQEPDLVFGELESLNRDTLAGVGIPLLEVPALCANPPADPSFDSIYDELRLYGKVFDKGAEAEAAVGRLQGELAEVLKSVDPNESRTAAVLYPTVGGGAHYAYGSTSMAQPQLEAAGFTNVFADTSERVFEVTLEELIGRDPDVLILLYSDGDADAVKASITGMNGAQALKAVKNDAVMTQLFNFTEPPTPLAIDGLKKIVERFTS
jgi:iron complex transport system substrate-binding protein